RPGCRPDWSRPTRTGARRRPAWPVDPYAYGPARSRVFPSRHHPAVPPKGFARWPAGARRFTHGRAGGGRPRPGVAFLRGPDDHAVYAARRADRAATGGARMGGRFGAGSGVLVPSAVPARNGVGVRDDERGGPGRNPRSGCAARARDRIWLVA